MSKFGRFAVCVLGAVVLTSVGVFGIAPAESRSPTRDESMSVCAHRVNELEVEVRALREELRSANGRQEFAAHKGTRPTESSRGLVGRHTIAGTQAGTCDPPYSFDRHGIKYYNPECLNSEEHAPCATPFGYTASGIKYYDPSCLDVVPSRVSCDPPFYFDSRAVKHYRAECL